MVGAFDLYRRGVDILERYPGNNEEFLDGPVGLGRVFREQPGSTDQPPNHIERWTAEPDMQTGVNQGQVNDASKLFVSSEFRGAKIGPKSSPRPQFAHYGAMTSLSSIQ